MICITFKIPDALLVVSTDVLGVGENRTCSRTLLDRYFVDLGPPLEERNTLGCLISSFWATQCDQCVDLI